MCGERDIVYVDGSNVQWGCGHRRDYTVNVCESPVMDGYLSYEK
jgi:hypothetical protein